MSDEYFIAKIRKKHRFLNFGEFRYGWFGLKRIYIDKDIVSLQYAIPFGGVWYTKKIWRLR